MSPDDFDAARKRVDSRRLPTKQQLDAARWQLSCAAKVLEGSKSPPPESKYPFDEFKGIESDFHLAVKRLDGAMLAARGGAPLVDKTRESLDESQKVLRNIQLQLLQLSAASSDVVRQLLEHTSEALENLGPRTAADLSPIGTLTAGNLYSDDRRAESLLSEAKSHSDKLAAELGKSIDSASNRLVTRVAKSHKLMAFHLRVMYCSIGAALLVAIVIAILGYVTQRSPDSDLKGLHAELNQDISKKIELSKDAIDKGALKIKDEVAEQIASSQTTAAKSFSTEFESRMRLQKLADVTSTLKDMTQLAEIATANKIDRNVARQRATILKKTIDDAKADLAKDAEEKNTAVDKLNAAYREALAKNPPAAEISKMKADLTSAQQEANDASGAKDAVANLADQAASLHDAVNNQSPSSAPAATGAPPPPSTEPTVKRTFKVARVVDFATGIDVPGWARETQQLPVPASKDIQLELEASDASPVDASTVEIAFQDANDPSKPKVKPAGKSVCPCGQNDKSFASKWHVDGSQLASVTYKVEITPKVSGQITKPDAPSAPQPEGANPQNPPAPNLQDPPAAKPQDPPAPKPPDPAAATPIEGAKKAAPNAQSDTKSDSNKGSKKSTGKAANVAQ